MRKLLVLATLVPLFAVAAQAQTEVPSTPMAEAYASYSFTRLGLGHGFEAANLNWGWNTAVVGNVNSWLGAMADFAGYYGRQDAFLTGLTPGQRFGSIPSGTPQQEVGRNIHTFLFGPRFTSRHSSRYTPFGHTLFGVGRIHSDATLANPIIGGTPLRLDDTMWPFAMKVGGGIDVKVNDMIYVRPFEANYLLMRPNGDNINNLSLSVGLAFRFGTR